MDSILVSIDGKTAIGSHLAQKDRPESFTVVTTLEVVLRFRGENYVLVSYFRYPDGVGFANDFREGPWAPPALATPLKIKRRHDDAFVQTTQQIVKRFRKGRHNWKDDANKLMSMLGVDDGQPKKVGELIEIKPSLRNPDIKRAYHVIRTRWTPEVPNSDVLRNLADPLCVRGFAFIPTSRKTLKTYSSTKDLSAAPLYFLGKPVVSNLKRLLCDKPFGGSFKTATGVVEIEPQHLVLKERGFLIQVDMAGFGAACAFLDSFGTFTRHGEEHAEEFRHQLHSSFSTILARAGISQSRQTGDGFLCGIPERGDTECKGVERVARFLAAYSDHLKVIEEMNSRLSANIQAQYAIGSRLAIHYGSYNFGRISGPISLVADFDGPEIISVARSEAGLKQIGEILPNPTDVAHRAIVSAEGVDHMGGQDAVNEVMRKNKFTAEGKHTTKMKEASVGGDVFRWGTI